MTTILERFYAFVLHFMSFSFQVLCIISEKIKPDRASLVSLRSCTSKALPTTQNTRYWFCGYNRLNFYLLIHELLFRQIVNLQLVSLVYSFTSIVT